MHSPFHFTGDAARSAAQAGGLRRDLVAQGQASWDDAAFSY